MSIQKIFESLDENIFTDDLKEKIETKFNEAVDAKAVVLAEDKINKEIEDLNEKSEKHIEFLNEKAEEYVNIQKDEIIEYVDKYLDRIVEEFVQEAKEKLDESEKSEKADMIIEAFDSMIKATGVKVAQIVEAKDTTAVDKQLNETVEKYDELINEHISLKEENEKLIKAGVILEMKQGMSIVEAEKFEKLAELVEFTKDETFVEKLELIKENVLGAAENELDEDLHKDLHKNKSAWAHLI